MGMQQPESETESYVVSDVADILNQNPDAKKILDAAIDDGYEIRYAAKTAKYDASFNPERKRFVINRYKLPNKGAGAMGLLFELIRYKNYAEKQALEQKARDGKLTADEYAVECERLSYKYMKEHHSIVQKGIKEDKWNSSYDKFGDELKEGGDFETFDKYLEAMKTRKDGLHYKTFLEQYKALRKQKPEE